MNDHSGDKPVTLVGTTHVAPTSRQRVIETIREVEPAHIAIELDAERFRRLWNSESLGVHDLLASGLSVRAAVLGYVILARQRKIATEMGLDPGEADMLPAARTAREAGVTVSLIDVSSIDLLNRLAPTVFSVGAVRGALVRLLDADERDKIRRGGADLTNLLPDELDEAATEEVVTFLDSMPEDQIQRLFDALGLLFPTQTNLFISERDAHMAGRIHHLRRSADGPVVAVVGRGHVEGIRRLLNAPDQIPDEHVRSSPRVRFIEG